MLYKKELIKKYGNKQELYLNFIKTYVEQFNFSTIIFDNKDMKNKKEMEIFENINSSGKKLSIIALIKNYIINLCDSSLIEEDDREIISTYCHTFESYSEVKDEKNLEKFYITLHEYITGNEISNNQEEKYKSIKKDINILSDNKTFCDHSEYSKFITKLEKYLNIYLWLNNTKRGKIDHCKEFLEDFFDNKTLLIIFTLENVKRRLLITISYFLFDIFSNNSNKNQKYNSSIIRKIYLCIIKYIITATIISGQGESSIKRYIIKSINEIKNSFGTLDIPLDELLIKIKEKFKNNNKLDLIDFYNKLKNNIKNNQIFVTLLYLVEMKMNNESSNIVLNNKISLEHIMPKNGGNWINNNNPNWEVEHRENINKIGNFLIISSDKNSKLGNKTFLNKKITYEKEIGVYKLYKCYENIDIDVSNKNDWTFDDIDKRTHALIEYIKENIIK